MRFQAGAIAVLEKPFPLKEFLDLVAQICEETSVVNVPDLNDVTK